MNSQSPVYPKRLIEVDLPIARISAHARREKSIRHGHISTLHIWWARRPLAACRAVLCAALWPDPADPNCPQAFRDAAARRIAEFAEKVYGTSALHATASRESFGQWEGIVKAGKQGIPFDTRDRGHLNKLRFALLDFVADFANWDNSTAPAYLETSRALTRAAHEALGGEPGSRPLVVDPFAGGGSIPLEALRVGADAFASDLNPVAVLLNKVVLEYIPRYGQKLADEVRKWGAWVKEQAEKELAEFYPKDPDGATPIAYLWARTIQCEGPGCGAEVPLMRSLWLAKKANRSAALKMVVKEAPGETQGGKKPGDKGIPSVLGGTGFQPVASETLTRRNLPHIQIPGFVYHVIFRTKNIELPPEARKIALDACLFWNGEKATVHACVVMPDHVHLLLMPGLLPDGRGAVSLSELTHSIKSFSANKINALLGRSGALWLDESYDRYIRSESDFAEKFDYIRRNPVEDGLVQRAEDYPFLYLAGHQDHPRLEAGATQSLALQHPRLEAGATQSPSSQTGLGQDQGGTGFQPVASEIPRLEAGANQSLAPRKSIDFQIIHNPRAADVVGGTVQRGSATCPCCGFTTPVASVRAQLKARKGGARDARLFAVVTTRPNEQGRFYRLPTDADLKAAHAAEAELEKRKTAWKGELSLVPEELTPRGGGSGAGRAFSQRHYGMEQFCDLFTPRQLLSLTTLGRYVREAGEHLAKEHDAGLAEAVQSILACAVDREAEHLSSICRWNSSGQKMQASFGRQAIPMMWDFCEANPFGGSVGSWDSLMECVIIPFETCLHIDHAGNIERVSAAVHPLPNDSATGFITDPPYYDAIPYSDLSDFFYVWLRRNLPGQAWRHFVEALAPKADECIVDEVKGKDKAYFEKTMAQAMAEGRRVLHPSGIGVVVFAHKSTAGWEAQLQSMVDAGWTMTGSWPIDTEMGTRLRAMDSAALASSVHLVVRPREDPDGSLRTDEIGDWRDVLAELPRRIHDWMPRLASEGVVGADAIFACLGPALEIFSRYGRVEKSNGDAVPLREYLEHVWAAVSNEALAMIFKDADAAGLEPDARLTAMWLWTLGSTGGTAVPPGPAGAREQKSRTGVSPVGPPTSDEAEDPQDDEDMDGVGKASGFVLEFDAARKIAQGLGVHLEKVPSVVEVKGDKARLLSVAERTRHLFGKGSVEPTGPKKKPRKKENQLSFFAALREADEAEGAEKPELKAPAAGTTVLDRAHQAMVLFAAGRGEAIKRFLVEDGVGKDARFWKLAQSLSALYPPGTDEKRWVDGVLARKKGLGL